MGLLAPALLNRVQHRLVQDDNPIVSEMQPPLFRNRRPPRHSGIAQRYPESRDFPKPGASLACLALTLQALYATIMVAMEHAG